ncbi:MAG: hypothetical protein JXA25_14715 [Anaerolineales bacterium]|nr:hypothetical protein [Anaerolineales bacterium]
MNELNAIRREKTRTRWYSQFRSENCPDLVSLYNTQELPWVAIEAEHFIAMCAAEVPRVFPDESIVFTRTTPEPEDLYSSEAYTRFFAGRTCHELGPINNITPDWQFILQQGLNNRRSAALQTQQKYKDDPEKAQYLACVVKTIDAALDLASRYAEEAFRIGNMEAGQLLKRVPANAAASFHEALQCIRFTHSLILLAGHYQIGFGRMDQILLPWYHSDLSSGSITPENAYELIVEFLISLNRDTDLYPGVQPGDNGQTLMLGGLLPDSSDGENELTHLFLKAAKEVRLIDPKINVRVHAGTSLELLEAAVELNKQGFGFPQYCNDDVVIPALITLGYSEEDAHNYSVAACWEFIIPGKGLEVVNIGAVSFPYAADTAIRYALRNGKTFSDILQHTDELIEEQTGALVKTYSKLVLPPAPFLSVVMENCIERGDDLSEGLTYNNYGIHGAGSSNAADALSAVKHFIYDSQEIEPAALLHALETDYEGNEDLRLKLLNHTGKIGLNDDTADGLMAHLFDTFSRCCWKVKDNGRGGQIRAGTGSAMYYIWLAQGNDQMREPVVHATAEGRRAGQPLSANLSPSLGVRPFGPFSIFNSFAKLDYSTLSNGGPITLELSSSVFRGPDGIQKVAALIRMFMEMGNQQLQLNCVSPATLLDAKEYPEKYPDLVVRVWGWSGYFCELSAEYQDQIIQRHIFDL